MTTWNSKAKRLLKSELVKRGISNADLTILLNQMGIKETKSSIDSKISRGTFSASFLLQCLSAIACKKIEIIEYESPILMKSQLLAAEPKIVYQSKNTTMKSVVEKQD